MTTKGQRVAIVTGAFKGIGRAIALPLAKDGIAVVVNYSSSSEAAASVVAEIEAGGGKAVAVQADIGSPTAAADLFNAAEEGFGGADILVNNAGILKLAPLADTDDESFRFAADRDQPHRHVPRHARSRPAGSGTAAASSISRPASSAPMGRPTGSMPPPRLPSRR
jgi:NAD(P)-dependent dehydrogenase (short-subunit alcohol dehydrogenase family)